MDEILTAEQKATLLKIDDLDVRAQVQQMLIDSYHKSLVNKKKTVVDATKFVEEEILQINDDLGTQFAIMQTCIELLYAPADSEIVKIKNQLNEFSEIDILRIIGYLFTRKGSLWAAWDRTKQNKTPSPGNPGRLTMLLSTLPGRSRVVPASEAIEPLPPNELDALPVETEVIVEKEVVSTNGNGKKNS